MLRRHFAVLIVALLFTAAARGQENPSPTGAPCPGTARAEHVLKLCRDQRQGMFREHEQEWTRYRDVLRQAGEQVADYRRTMAACGTWNETLKALAFLFGSFDGSAEELPGAQEIQKARLNLATVAGTVARLGRRERGEEKIAPGELDQALQRFDLAVEDLGNVLDGMADESTEEMAEQAERCGVRVPAESFQKAQSYLELVRSALQMVQEIGQRVDGLRDKERDCLQKQFQVYKACVETARCQGTPESACAAGKPPGDWPAIPPEGGPAPAPATAPQPPGSSY